MISELLDDTLKQIIPASDAVAIDIGRRLCESGVGSRSCSMTNCKVELDDCAESRSNACS
jgi:hypothetical protein